MNEEGDRKLEVWIEERERVFQIVFMYKFKWDEAKPYVVRWYESNYVKLPPTDEALRVAVHRMMLLNADTPEELRTYATNWLVENGHSNGRAVD